MRRLTLDFIVDFFSSRGYTLVSPEYKNNRQKLRYVCPNGHIGQTKWGNFRLGFGCPVCSGNSSPSIEELVCEFSLRDCILTTYHYHNRRQKLRYVCAVGHETTISLNDFRSGCGCSICARNHRLTLSYVREGFVKEGYLLLSTDYINIYQKLLYVCSRGHSGSIRWNDFQQGKRCSVCMRASKSAISQLWLTGMGISDVIGTTREVWLLVFDRKFRVDGFDPETNTVYEFLGDYWHGNPDRFYVGDVHPTRQVRYDEIFGETFQKLESMAGIGYKVVYVWEKDFRAGKNISGIIEPHTQHLF